MAELVPVEYIERRIVELRGAKVIIGPDLPSSTVSQRVD